MRGMPWELQANAQMQQEIQELKTRPSALTELQRKKADFLSDMEKFNKLISNLQARTRVSFEEARLSIACVRSVRSEEAGDLAPYDFSMSLLVFRDRPPFNCSRTFSPQTRLTAAVPYPSTQIF